MKAIEKVKVESALDTLQSILAQNPPEDITTRHILTGTLDYIIAYFRSISITPHATWTKNNTDARLLEMELDLSELFHSISGIINELTQDPGGHMDDDIAQTVYGAYSAVGLLRDRLKDRLDK